MKSRERDKEINRGKVSPQVPNGDTTETQGTWHQEEIAVSEKYIA